MYIARNTWNSLEDDITTEALAINNNLTIEAEVSGPGGRCNVHCVEFINENGYAWGEKAIKALAELFTDEKVEQMIDQRYEDGELDFLLS